MQDSDPLVGTLFADRFQIDACLGRGGMGAVYRARHTILGRHVAVKVILKGLITDNTIEARFRREARAASRVISPQVAAVFDFGHTDDGYPYLVMEYVEGETLAALQQREGLLPLPRALGILTQVCEGLAAAHAAGVVHRDLKPQNIVLAARGERDLVKVLDFGLAKLLDAATVSPLSVEGATFGTPEYISPEQCAGGEVDHRADLYSFGVLAFELLCGARPFQGAIVKLMTAHLHQEPPRPSSIVPGRLPAPLEELVLRCLAKSPAARPRGAAELGAELARIARDLSPTATSPDVPPPSSDALTRAELRLSPPQPTDAQRSGLCELALTVRDRGLGSPDLSAAMAALVTEEDRLLELEARAAAVEQARASEEARATARETRLRQALAQLERERTSAALPLDPSRTLPLGSQAAPGLLRVEESTQALSRSIAQLAASAAQRATELEAELDELQLEAAVARATADERREQLLALLLRVQREEGARFDVELRQRYLEAGLG